MTAHSGKHFLVKKYKSGYQLCCHAISNLLTAHVATLNADFEMKVHKM